MGKGEYTDGKVKVTIRLNPELVTKTKHYAIEHHTSLQNLIERALELKQRLDHLLLSLSPREEKVLRLRYGPLGDGQTRTLRRAAASLGGSHELVRQIEMRALRKIKRALGVKGRL